ncbi:MAG: glycogen/starch synthase, partial [Dokdonia donghaensis]|nr:glycogen/starch synthase [Dokdonia donghaensis]
LYLKQYYASEPLFTQSKIVTSVYNQGFEGSLNSELLNKVAFDGVDPETIKELEDPTYENLMKVTIRNSDAAIVGSQDLNENLLKILNTTKIPVLPYKKKEEFPQAYEDFYTTQVLEE